MKDPERLYFPPEIAGEIGLSGDAIRQLKRKGCPFHGRKTTITWVRQYLARAAGAIGPVLEQVSADSYPSAHR